MPGPRLGPRPVTLWCAPRATARPARPSNALRAITIESAYSNALLAVMCTHPQVCVDVSVIVCRQPSKAFYR
jgi:hypothetical protein